MEKVLLSHRTGGAYGEDACELALERARAFVLNYCNIDAIPDGLRETVLDIAAELLTDGAARDAAFSDGVHAVTVGDARVELQTVDDLTFAAIGARYRSVLNRYRRIRFE